MFKSVKAYWKKHKTGILVGCGVAAAGALVVVLGRDRRSNRDESPVLSDRMTAYLDREAASKQEYGDDSGDLFVMMTEKAYATENGPALVDKIIDIVHENNLTVKVDTSY